MTTNRYDPSIIFIQSTCKCGAYTSMYVLCTSTHSRHSQRTLCLNGLWRSRYSHWTFSRLRPEDFDEVMRWLEWGGSHIRDSLFNCMDSYYQCHHFAHGWWKSMSIEAHRLCIKYFYIYGQPSVLSSLGRALVSPIAPKAVTGWTLLRMICTVVWDCSLHTATAHICHKCDTLPLEQLGGAPFDIGITFHQLWGGETAALVGRSHVIGGQCRTNIKWRRNSCATAFATFQSRLKISYVVCGYMHIYIYVHICQCICIYRLAILYAAPY